MLSQVEPQRREALVGFFSAHMALSARCAATSISKAARRAAACSALSLHSSRLLVTSATRFLYPLTEALSAWYLLFQRSRLFRKDQITAPGRLLKVLGVCVGVVSMSVRVASMRAPGAESSESVELPQRNRNDKI